MVWPRRYARSNSILRRPRHTVRVSLTAATMSIVQGTSLVRYVANSDGNTSTLVCVCGTVDDALFSLP